MIVLLRIIGSMCIYGCSLLLFVIETNCSTITKKKLCNYRHINRAMTTKTNQNSTTNDSIWKLYYWMCENEQTGGM